MPGSTKILDFIYWLATLLISVAFLLDKRADFLFNPLLTTIFYLFLLGMERYTIFTTKEYIKLLLILILFSHNFFGEYLDAYNQTQYFDDIMHFFGTFSFTLFAYSLISTFITVKSSHPSLFTFLNIITLGVSLGAIFELGEFLLDLVLYQENQRGIVDTNIDLIFDILGSIAVAFFIIWKDPCRSKIDKL